LGRLSGLDYDGDETQFTAAQRNSIAIINNRVYRHKVLRVNYTTYDLRRAQDSLNPRTQANIMVLAYEHEEENPHPYWYARIIGIFHVNVRYTSPGEHHTSIKRVDFLWVRWFARDIRAPSGWAMKRLPRVGFYEAEDPSAFGFLDPDLVIHGVQLIPAFRFGRTSILLGPSIARPEADHDEDWDWYYVNMCVQVPVICAVNLRISRFVDRDMFMRFRGGGVGHKSMRTEMRCLLDDRDTLDKLPFKMEKERSQSRSESSEEDDDMAGEDEDNDNDNDDDGEDDEGEGEHDSDEDSKEGNEIEHEAPAATPFAAYVDDQVADEMDEYGYSGLDQVANEDEENEEIDDDEDMFGPEDGEDMINELDEDNDNFAYL